MPSRTGLRMTDLQILGRAGALALTATLTAAGLSGCKQADEAPGNTLGGSGGSAGSSAAGAGGEGGSAGSGSGGSPVVVGGNSSGGTAGASSAGTGGSNNELCGTINEDATAKELYLYMMVDRSESMRGAKWDAVEAGLQAFLEDENSEGIHVALNFFPKDEPAGCNGTQFQDPRVDYGVLPGHAAALTQTILDEPLSTNGTPTYTALGGAVLAAMTKAQEVPDEVSAVLLVSDGAPQGSPTTCDGGVQAHDVDDIAAVAAKGNGLNPPVTTYVVAIEGLPKSFADKIASEGGSDESIQVGLTNAAEAFAQALAQIRGQAVPCRYDIPDSVGTEDIDFDEVNVLYTADGETDPTYIPYSEDCAADNGWHYDNAADPKEIILCDDRCSEIQADYRANVSIELGCEQVIPH